METGDSLDITGRDSDGLVKAIGYLVKDSTGQHVGDRRHSDQHAGTAGGAPRRVERCRRPSAAVVSSWLRTRWIRRTTRATPSRTGRTLRFRVKAGREAGPGDLYAFGHTTALPDGSLGADIAVDTRALACTSRTSPRTSSRRSITAPRSPSCPPVSVGAQPWGMAIDNSGSMLLVANSGGTNISRVDLGSRSGDGSNQDGERVSLRRGLVEGPDERRVQVQGLGADRLLGSPAVHRAVGEWCAVLLHAPNDRGDARYAAPYRQLPRPARRAAPDLAVRHGGTWSLGDSQRRRGRRARGPERRARLDHRLRSPGWIRIQLPASASRTGRSPARWHRCAGSEQTSRT